MCLNDWSSSYSDILQKGNLTRLSNRRSVANLSNIHKIVHNLTDFPGALVNRISFHYSSRANNSLSLKLFNCKSSPFHNSYFPKTVSSWNTLPAEVVQLKSTSTFKNSIHKLIIIRLHLVTCSILAVLAIHVSPVYTTYTETFSFEIAIYRATQKI